MKRGSLRLAGVGVVLVLALALGVRYFQITGGRIKTCGFDGIVYCLTGTCKLDVEVKSCAAGGSGIKVETDDLHMCNPGKIMWKLTTRGYKFADDGIEFKAPEPDFDGRVKNDEKFEWNNKHTHPANDSEPPVEWKYKVHILKSDNSDCATLDPRIYNE